MSFFTKDLFFTHKDERYPHNFIHISLMQSLLQREIRYTTHKIILYSSQWEIKAVIRSHTLKHNQKLNCTQHLNNSKSKTHKHASTHAHAHAHTHTHTHTQTHTHTHTHSERKTHTHPLINIHPLSLSLHTLKYWSKANT